MPKDQRLVQLMLTSVDQKTAVAALLELQQAFGQRLEPQRVYQGSDGEWLVICNMIIEVEIMK